ncbi:MAG: hypothetical protein AMK71_09830 [Nitrospira bacterium SG8_35_4]|nr:MAG: hypothetical protein AMK71_09830 [Nitrospira bacterium SG8_35_4]
MSAPAGAITLAMALNRRTSSTTKTTRTRRSWRPQGTGTERFLNASKTRRTTETGNASAASCDKGTGTYLRYQNSTIQKHMEMPRQYVMQFTRPGARFLSLP